MGRAENYVEGYLDRQAAAHGWVCYKLTSPGRNGFPDRVIIGNGYTIFVETKSRVGRPSEHQKLRWQEINGHGGILYFLNTREGVDELFRTYSMPVRSHREPLENEKLFGEQRGDRNA